MKKLSLLIVLFVLGVYTLIAQTKVITGTISSAVQGEGPIPGVTVQVKGTTIGTTTDANGKYSITVPDNATTLIFSYIGMKKIEVDIAGRAIINGTLESDVLGLNEVIVSAFGIKRNANEIGSAVTKVETDLITQAKATNAASALSGKVAGLQINTVNASVNPDVRVILRGNRSFLGNNQALLVLDGVPVNLAYLATLNPNDIESMNVLKGGNAAALYGSEAANGVIVVTTKSGSKDKTSIQFSSTVTLDKIAFFPDLQKRFGSGSASDGFGNPVYDPFENQCWGPEFDGSMVQIGLDDEFGNKYMVPYTAQPKEKYKFWDTGVTTQNDLTFSSGNETGTIYLALQDVKVTGLVPGDKGRRDVFRLNASKIYKGFTATANINYTARTIETGDSPYWNVMNTPMQVPLTKFSDWSGVYKDASGNPVTNWADINHYFNAYYPNPYESVARNRYPRRYDYITATLSLEQKFTSWLKLEVRSSMAPNWSYYENRYYSRTFSTYGHNMATLNGRAIGTSDVLSSMAEGQGFGWRWTNDAVLTFDKKFSDISVRAIAGATNRMSYSRSTDVSVGGFAIPDLFNVSNKTGELSGSESWSQQRQMGVFGDITIGYKNYAYLHASGRNDWTSLLDPSKWSFFYPGVDASVILSEIVPSLKNDIVSYIKVRGGISKVGAISIGNYALENTFGVASNFPFGGLSGYTVSNGLNNRYLEPEFTTSKEVGLDMSFLKNRLTTNITAYQTNTTNQTVNMSISNTTGYTSSAINTGEMLNRGLEVEVKSTPVQTANLRWDLNVNYAYWYNKVLSLAGDLTEISLGNYAYAIVGQPYPTMKTQQFLRDPQGRVIVDKVTGTPSADPNLVIRGQTVPKHLIGVQTNLSWKNLSFAASADYRGGHIFLSGLYDNLLFTGIGKLSAANGRERYVFPNSSYSDGAGGYVANTNVTTTDGGVAWWTNTMRPMVYYGVNSAAIWKIREMSLTYDMPASILKFTNGVVKGLKIGLVGRNLFMFMPKNNIYSDPEFSNTTGNAVGYSDSGQTPAARSYGFNITVTF
jgi:TonB-linked SusC/RagA family outer membrane protein